MESETKNSAQSSPRMMDAFITGFNTVTNNIYLILFPFLFDLMLWFGPHIRIKNMLLPVTEDFFNNITTATTPEMMQVIEASRNLWLTILDRVNLITLLRSFPIGIFNLLSSINPIVNPVGNPISIEITSVLQFFSLWLAFALAGLLLGSLYFSQVARCCSHEKFSSSIKALGNQTIHAIVLTFVLLVCLFLLSIPSTIVLSVMALINLVLAQGVLLLISLVFIWLLFPLFFSPHGIFYYNQKVLPSILNSARVIRYSLPATSLFVMMIILLSQGLNMIWTIPPETSWMMLIGIAGHAFTSTGLLASTFIYYRNIIQWLQANAKPQPAL